MFDPIQASQEIKDVFINYITTSLEIADTEFSELLKQALEQEDEITKGPFLDIGGSYETGRTLRDLIHAGKISRQFETLESVDESRKKLKLDRPLYLHQETALLKALDGESLVVTTGTGSGKTETFLIPILNHLLREQEAGTLGAGVRAILIYPMNALANDQVSRLRSLLKDYPAIRFGIYNGNTKHSRQDALADYRSTHHDEAGNPVNPIENECISREEMQQVPPHILITNYSMLEYMMLRPKDDAVFSSANLHFIVLDEAHIYRGATGMETSMLMRRLKARIGNPKKVQYILTSATLGGPEANGEIIQFAEKLCGTPFKESGIIRSSIKQPPMIDKLDFPAEMFEKLDENGADLPAILSEYHADFAPEKGNPEKLYALFLHCRLFEALRKAATSPITIPQLRAVFALLNDKQIIAFINVCAKAELDGSCLIKPRYHFFVRALEGAFISLYGKKQLFLQRRTEITSPEGDEPIPVFEAAVCDSCGSLALVGDIIHDHLVQTSGYGDNPTNYYVIQEETDGSADLPDEEEADTYILCTRCGAIISEADLKMDSGLTNPKFCNHDPSCRIRVRLIPNDPHSTGERGRQISCPECHTGKFRRFYLGSDAATGVLGTALYEQLPSVEISHTPVVQAPSQGLFVRKPTPQTSIKKLTKQFLCFSDSRSEAAFFASYMERTYQAFLRRRGVWHIAEEYRKQDRGSVSVQEFVRQLKRYFEEQKSFADLFLDNSNKENNTLSDNSERNAWIAILDEMYNARRKTSLSSLGAIGFRYDKNDDVLDYFQEAYHLTPEDARSLLELIIQDAVFSGAIKTSDYILDATDREYIFFTQSQKELCKRKTEKNRKSSNVTGWEATSHNNSFYRNNRMTRLVNALNISEAEANNILSDYWENVLKPKDNDHFTLDATNFSLLISGTSGAPFYRCKKCGKVTPHSLYGRCPNLKCNGELEIFNYSSEIWENNHYAKLYQSNHMEPLRIKEHTAQLSKDQQKNYQQAFIDKKINALSCSTTFEMGVDLGDLETVYLRDVPPSPANYVQRAGRAGRSNHSSAFVLTYAHLSSHDFTYYKDPCSMISGKIRVPVFELENEKILLRHVFAVAISSFLAQNPDVYDGDNRTVLLNEGGYQRLKDYLSQKPEALRQLLLRSIPEKMHTSLGINDFSWVDRLCGEGGILEIAIQDYQNTIAEMQHDLEIYRKNLEDEKAGICARNLKNFRCSREDNAGKKSLIDFLVRNNVLPKYGFPVDTVELYTDMSTLGTDKSLQLARDLQLAIAEYAPDSQVIADGKMYTSRYIRKTPGKASALSWEIGYYCPKCPVCGQANFTKDPHMENGHECVVCHTTIPLAQWHRTIEPRLGFAAEPKPKSVPMHRPEHDHKSDDYYIGDPHKNTILKQTFQVRGKSVSLESTSNDSLVVVGNTSYFVCPVCGYAQPQSKGPIKAHNNSRGFPCSGNSSATRYNLSHDFKTDVVRITFESPSAASKIIMQSVLYALLEGLASEMGIERTDIKGCLFQTVSANKFLFSVILYDAVAGGAGHVRRLVTKDGQAFQQVLKKSLEIVDHCSCDKSCYQCLRNYYNQKIHDQLDRKLAADFLREWIGEMNPITSDTTCSKQ